MRTIIPPSTEPLSEDDHNAAAEAQISLIWRDALEWARLGDRRSLVKLLRSKTMPLQDDADVRSFLADMLEKAKNPKRGIPPQRPEYTFHVDSEGRPKWVDTRDVAHGNLKKWIKENRKQSDVYKKAEDEFKELFSKKAKPPKKKKQVLKSGKEAGGRAANLSRRSLPSRIRKRAAIPS